MKKVNFFKFIKEQYLDHHCLKILDSDLQHRFKTNFSLEINWNAHCFVLTACRLTLSRPLPENYKVDLETMFEGGKQVSTVLRENWIRARKNLGKCFDLYEKSFK